MNTNDNKINNYSEVLNKKYGLDGTPERTEFEQNASDFYSGLVLHQARKEAKITQSELASRTGTTKSYISRIENGAISPSVGAFYRLIAALGMRIEIVKPIAWWIIQRNPAKCSLIIFLQTPDNIATYCATGVNFAGFLSFFFAWMTHIVIAFHIIPNGTD